MRPGPITSTCFPPESAESIGYVVRARLMPLPEYKDARAAIWVDEVFHTEAVALAFFNSVLKEDGKHLFSIGWGEKFPEDKHGDSHIEWDTYLTGEEILRALRNIA
jgi:hypothetical protein